MRETHRISHYHARLTVVVTDPGESLAAALRRHGLSSGGIPPKAEAVQFDAPAGADADRCRTVIALHPNAKPRVVAHEAVHAALSILYWYDVPLEPDGPNENLAYLVGEVVDKVNRTLRRARTESGPA